MWAPVRCAFCASCACCCVANSREFVANSQLSDERLELRCLLVVVVEDDVTYGNVCDCPRLRLISHPPAAKQLSTTPPQAASLEFSL